MNHYLLIDWIILQKQSFPPVIFIKEKFCLKFLCDHSALDIWKVITIYDINRCWKYEGQVKRSL